MSPVIQKESEFSVKQVIRLMAILLAVLLVLRVWEYAIYPLSGFAVLTTFQNRVERTFFILILLISLSIMNPVFFEKGFHFYLASRGTLLIMAIVMSIKAGFVRSAWFLSPFGWLFAYMGYIMLASLAGWSPIISEMKAFLFLAFMLALIQSMSSVVQSGVDARGIRAAMLVVASFFILGSVVSIPFPSIGRSMVIMRAIGYNQAIDVSELSGLFNGVTWHSQTLGPAVAMLNAFVLSDYLCSFKRKNTLYRVLLISVPVLVYMSSSRTAFFAYVISILSTVFFFMGERRVAASKRSRILMNVVFAVLAAFLFLVFRPHGMERLEAFLRKTQEIENMDRGESLTDSIMKSRMGLIEQGMENFRESPMIGNGFQVSKAMEEYDMSETGLLLSAPIEKGVLPVMVLEEGGIIGGVLLIAFLVALYVKYQKLQFTCFLSTFTVFLVLNSGEASFFSTSGGGGILWMICFCAMLMDIHRHRRMLAERQFQYPQGIAGYG